MLSNGIVFPSTFWAKFSFDKDKLFLSKSNTSLPLIFTLFGEKNAMWCKDRDKTEKKCTRLHLSYDQIERMQLTALIIQWWVVTPPPNMMGYSDLILAKLQMIDSQLFLNTGTVSIRNLFKIWRNTSHPHQIDGVRNADW